MEQADHQFLLSLGTSVVQPLAEQEAGWHLSWPRVHVDCDYAGTARFEDELRIKLRVLKLGTKSISYGFEFTNREQIIARGRLVAVCCKVKSGEPLQSMPIPAALASQLQDYIEDAESSER